MLDFISQAWPWYVGGPMIAFLMFSILWLGQRFGISSTLETLCTLGGAGKRISLFDTDWRKKDWMLVLAVGAILGGTISSTFLMNDEPLVLSQNTISDLEAIGVPFDGKYLPESLFNWETLLSLKGMILMVGGGFLIGFGTRYAGGCTSGHAISGLSEMQLPSLVATIGFFIGGLVSTYLLLPIILGL